MFTQRCESWKKRAGGIYFKGNIMAEKDFTEVAQRFHNGEKVFKAGTRVIVHEWVLDARCTSGLRRKSVTQGSLWSNPFICDDKRLFIQGMWVCRVARDDANFVWVENLALLLPITEGNHESV